MNSRGNSFLANIPVVTKNLIIINLLLWLASMVLPRVTNVDLNDILGLHYFQSKLFNPAQLITYMFMHASFSHIFFNMFALYMFGGILEQTWGPKRFLLYYVVTGVGAALIQMLVTYLRISSIAADLPPEALALVKNEGYKLLMEGKNYTDPALGHLNLLFNTVTIGASGAVFGILLAFGMMFPNMPLFIMFIPIPVKAKYFVIVYGLLELFLGIANRSGDNVAHFAHLGGMLFGLILILLWRKKSYN